MLQSASRGCRRPRRARAIASTSLGDIAAAKEIWGPQNSARILLAGDAPPPDVDILFNEGWPRTTYFSASRSGFVDIFFIDGQEGVCLVRCARPNPSVRLQHRSAHRFSPCTHLSTRGLAASPARPRLISGCCRTQGSWLRLGYDTWLASGGARGRGGDPAAKRWHSLADLCGGWSHRPAVADGYLRRG